MPEGFLSLTFGKGGGRNSWLYCDLSSLVVMIGGGTVTIEGPLFGVEDWIFGE